jgi:hypothetical protein
MLFIFRLTKYTVTMSKANSSARQRRAGGAVLPGQDTKTVSAPAPALTPQQQNGLSLQQVIALIDKRLVNLETFAKETKDAPPAAAAQSTSTVNAEEINAMADEFNSKFEMLATEVAEMKDIVLKLQAYTMEVNRTLMQERVRILSDMGSGGGIDISVQELGGDGSVGFTMSKAEE